MKRILPFALALCLGFLLTACTQRQNSTAESPVAKTPANNTTIKTTTDALPSYTFDEIIANKPTKFNDGGPMFTVSGDENYYGEITVGSRSYIHGASDIKGNYALFIVDSGTPFLEVKIQKPGFYLSYSDPGTIINNAVEYPFNADLNAGNMTELYESSTMNLWLKGLTHSEVYGNTQNSLFNPAAHFEILTCTITKDEAVRYVQDGTLPNCLQGLTVTGLEQILRKP